MKYLAYYKCKYLNVRADVSREWDAMRCVSLPRSLSLLEFHSFRQGWNGINYGKHWNSIDAASPLDFVTSMRIREKKPKRIFAPCEMAKSNSKVRRARVPSFLHTQNTTLKSLLLLTSTQFFFLLRPACIRIFRCCQILFINTTEERNPFAVNSPENFRRKKNCVCVFFVLCCQVLHNEISFPAYFVQMQRVHKTLCVFWIFNVICCEMTFKQMPLNANLFIHFAGSGDEKRLRHWRVGCWTSGWHSGLHLIRTQNMNKSEIKILIGNANSPSWKKDDQFPSERGLIASETFSKSEFYCFSFGIWRPLACVYLLPEIRIRR